MEVEGSLFCSQEPGTESCSEQVKSDPHPQTHIIKKSTNVVSILLCGV
jgi:hypothetical protein